MSDDIKDGDGEASRTRRLADLSSRYRKPLNRYFLNRIRNPADVEDMVQEVFTRLYANGMHNVRSEEGFLFATAANVLRDQARRDATRHRSAHDTLDDCNLPSDEATPEAALASRETLRLALLALSELPTRTQTVFALNRYEELSHPQIAHRLGVSVSSVEKHIMKAVAHLARRVPK